MLSLANFYKIYIQVTLEQHGFELSRYIYMRTFYNIVL